MRAILLNGPPRSGKDTIGHLLWSLLPCSSLHKFAQPIIDFMRRSYSVDFGRVEKDLPSDLLGGRTPRQVAIAYSELFCKPLWGQDYFGHLAAQAVATHTRNGQEFVIFTDSGFVHEAMPVLKQCGVGMVLQIRISRTGCNYQGDSRSTWDHPEIGHLDFDNDFPGLDSLEDAVRHHLAPMIKKILK